MDNPAYDVDMEMDNLDIPPDDDDYSYNTSNTTRAEETPLSSQQTGTSTLRSRQGLLIDKINSFYKHLDTKERRRLLSDEIDANQFKIEKNTKTGVTDLLFNNSKKWISLTDQRTGKFLALSTLEKRFGGKVPVENFLNLEQTPPAPDRSIEAASEVKSKIPAQTQTNTETMPLSELFPLVKDIRITTREASQNTDLDMREFLGIDKALQTIQGELRNNTAKLCEIDKRIKQDTAKLKEIEDNSEAFSEEQKELYQKRLQDLKEERQAGSNFYHKTVRIFKHK